MGSLYRRCPAELVIPSLYRYNILPVQPANTLESVMTKISLGAQPLLYPEPALLVCTYDTQGKANAMVAAWGGICSSEPLCLSVSVRPMRWTHDPLLKRKAFTVGIPSESMMTAADYLGIASGRHHNKLSATGLTAVRSEKVDAPYIAECPVVLECALRETLTVGSHVLMIGEIVDVLADKACMAEGKQYPDIAKVAPLIYDSGSKAYYSIGPKVGDAFSAGKAFLSD